MKTIYCKEDPKTKPATASQIKMIVDLNYYYKFPKLNMPKGPMLSKASASF
jgi:hypothetical protein